MKGRILSSQNPLGWLLGVLLARLWGEVLPPGVRNYRPWPLNCSMLLFIYHCVLCSPGLVWLGVLGVLGKHVLILDHHWQPTPHYVYLYWLTISTHLPPNDRVWTTKKKGSSEF